MTAVARNDVAYTSCGNILLDRLFGANIHSVEPAQVDVFASDLVERLKSAGRTPYLVPYGGSSAIGALGYVEAFCEIACENKGKPVAAIVHASSSGATQAGLSVGAEREGSDTRILGVNVLKPRVHDLHEDVRRQVRELAQILSVNEDSAANRVEMVDGYLGSAYGEPTPLMVEALTLAARTEGLVLDPVYSAKAFAGLLGEVRRGRFASDEKVIFLHTGGAVALHAYPDLFPSTESTAFS